MPNLKKQAICRCVRWNCSLGAQKEKKMCRLEQKKNWMHQKVETLWSNDRFFKIQKVLTRWRQNKKLFRFLVFFTAKVFAWSVAPTFLMHPKMLRTQFFGPFKLKLEKLFLFFCLKFNQIPFGRWPQTKKAKKKKFSTSNFFFF